MTWVLVNKDLWLRMLPESKKDWGLTKERPVFVDITWVSENKDLFKILPGSKMDWGLSKERTVFMDMT